jgi:membrane-bound metal-dependent hydrolase YbcI (DUF457 family)
MMGLVLGNLLPDADNFAVAFATLTGGSTEGLHRTFTHSLFTVLLIVLLFGLAGRLSRQPRWTNLGLGLGAGILMHIMLDLLIWFNGVEILWPLSSWLDLWQNVEPAAWWMELMMPGEFLAFALFLLLLASTARKRPTDLDYLKPFRFCTLRLFVFLLLFTVLLFVMEEGFLTIYGAAYLISLSLTTGITLRMRETVESL